MCGFDVDYDKIDFMKKETIIQTLKDNYNRDLRKQVVKTMLRNEKESDTPENKIINQIFSYVLSQLGWDMAKNTSQWDSTPLDIMKETFPKIETTKWYKEMILTAEQSIDVEMRD